MLTYEEKIAILMAMCCVIGADGEFQPEEKTLRGKMMIYLDLYHNKEDGTKIIKAIDEMTAQEAVNILSAMNMTKKKFAVAVLIETMKADGRCTPEEKHTIDVFSRHANLPYITDEEARQILKCEGLVGSAWNMVWRTLF